MPKSIAAHGDGDQGKKGEKGSLAIVGIGASAGGLAALKVFFGNMPENPGVAFVVVVHLSPEHESHLSELIQPHCKMPVEQVSDTVQLEPNRVYVIPPNANLSTIDTHLRLSKLEEERRQRAPIDHFFRTLAETHDGHSIGVILTGSGSDGTLGLRRIKEQRGLTIAQDPEEAEHDGMPRSAIGSGMVDLVLPLKRIPTHILRFARTQPRIPIPAEGDEVEPDESRVLQKIYAQIRARTGHDFSQYKKTTILRRIARRMQFHHIETLANYLDFMRDHRDEVVDLFNDLLITVTEFFRDRDVYDRIERQIMPRLFKDLTSDDRIRVWSVGCSTGEEAYSLAMLLLEEAGRRETHPQIQVFASDLHEKALEKARDGIYPEEIATDVSPQRLQRFFIKENGHYRVRREVREIVVFAPHNLLRDPPFSHVNFIVCRNLLIYLQRDVQQDVVGLFHYALEPEGLLLLGTSETIERHDLFVHEDKDACLYRRLNVPTREPRLPMFPMAAPTRIGHGHRHGDAAVEHIPARSFGGIHERMVERYAPPSVLVNAENEVVHYSANAGRYMQLPGGEPTSNLFRLVREPLRIELRAALHSAQKDQKSVGSKPIALDLGGQGRRVAIRVQPALEPDLAGFFLIIFDEQPEQFEHRAGDGQPSSDAHAATVREVEEELKLTKQRLQTIIEEYDTSREEMQASNEELQSANEELRSTMEELETSKEELQSMNEELTTVNQENRHRVEELAQLSGDLQNLIIATDIATLFLDRDLRIIRFTPQVGELFNVRHTDKGRPFSDLTHHLKGDSLQEDARQVLVRLAPVERELRTESGLWFLTRVLPYRGADDRIEGVVITFIDITRRKRAEEEVAEAREFAESIVETLHEPLLVLGPDLTVRSVNAAFYERFKGNREDTIGRMIYDLGNGQWDIPELRTLLEDVLPESNVFNDYEVTHDFEDIGRRVMLLNARRLDHVQLILLGIRDITDRKQHEEHLRTLLAELDHRVKNTLALVLALARQSADPANSLDDFIARFEGRLGALAAAHQLMASAQWRGSPLRDVITAIGRPYISGDDDAANLRLGGPDLNIRATAAVSLAMVFHELFTNAGKYGALSTPHGGIIEVRWITGTHLDLTWREHKGSPSKESPTAKPEKSPQKALLQPDPASPLRKESGGGGSGFGRQFIKKTIEYELVGQAVMELLPDGIRWSLRIPMSSLTPDPVSG